MHRYFLIPMIGFFLVILGFVIYLQFINENWKYLVPKANLPDSCNDLSDVELVIHQADYLEGRSFTDNPDIINGKQIHVIYLLPCEREDRRFDVNSNIEFSSDFIIGYPGETDKDFSDTLELLKKIRFVNSFSFIFSPRPGTTAAKLEMIDNEIAKERLIIIQKKLFKNQIELNKSMESKKIEVLVENIISSQNKLFGRNKYLSSVIFKGHENLVGKLVDVKITSSNQNTLFGEIETDMRAA